jgi:hypothetical protein
VGRCQSTQGAEEEVDLDLVVLFCAAATFFFMIMYKLGVLFLFFYMQILFYKKLNDKLMKNK